MANAFEYEVFINIDGEDYGLGARSNEAAATQLALKWERHRRQEDLETAYVYIIRPDGTRISAPFTGEPPTPVPPKPPGRRKGGGFEFL